MILEKASEQNRPVISPDFVPGVFQVQYSEEQTESLERQCNLRRVTVQRGKICGQEIRNL